MEVVHALAASFPEVFGWPTIGFMVLGVAIGFAIGMLPGLGGPVAIAVMLPFTFDMSTSQAFAFLLGAVSVLAMTGDVTSILYGIPGDPGSAALVLDGHPLAVQGQAGRAIGAMLTSSVVGAVVGALALAASIPVLRPVLLHFGSPEYFALALVGLTFIVALGGSNVLKGLICGGLGLLLSMVGVNHESGIARYTFGQLSLWDGLGLVPVAIGLFAIPELLDVSARGAIATTRERVGDVMQGVRDTFARLWLTLRCSLLGTGAGLIPGLGGTVAQWLAYAHSTQTAKNAKPFGTGAIEGVIGPGAAQNSKEGSNLIAMVAFGIPTSVTMALLLGALNIKGLVPGVPMLTENLTVTASFVWLIVASHLVAVLFTLALLGRLVRVTSIRASLLVPLLVSIAFLGALAERNSMIDVWLSLAFGLLGVALVRLDWPRAPLILGLVLGSLMERNLSISVSRYGLAWLAHPVVLALLVVAVASLALPRLRRRVPAPAAPAPAAPHVAVHRALQARWEALFTLAILSVSIVAIALALPWPNDTRLFPIAIGAPLALLSLGRLVQLALAARRSTQPRPMGTESSAAQRRRYCTAAWMAGFTLVVSVAGFGLGSPLAALGFVKFVGRERWLTSGAVALVLAMLMWGASLVLPVPIYPGNLIGLDYGHLTFPF